MMAVPDRGPSPSIMERTNPLTFSWKNINATVPKTLKRILIDLNGIVQPGTLLAIMGASGAGKSTLLNVLNGRHCKEFTISGSIYVNGFPVPNANGVRNISAYVQQDNLFFATLTVREQLQFRALLRMDKSVGRKARLVRVEEVIQEMGLTSCANDRIGDPGSSKKGISGGERKRLSFASEALTNPPIFFCDEPTSGLDMFMAKSIVQVLQAMAEKGQTILCTIHQPSSDLFEMFHQILLLAEGRTAFHGPSDQAMKFFEEMGSPCPPNHNPTDHFILTLAVVPGLEDESRRHLEHFCGVFEASSYARSVKQDIEVSIAHAKDNPNDPIVIELQAGRSSYEANWMTQFRYLMWRSWVSMFRDVMLFRVRIAQAFFFAIVLGLLYLQLTVDQKGVMSINGAIFICIINTTLTNVFAVINSFPMEIGIFLREYGSGLYRSDVYYFSKTIVEVPLLVTVAFIFSTVTYWMMGLYPHWEEYLIFAGVLILTANVAVSLGYLISTISGSVTLSLALAPPVVIPFLLFGGLFLNTGSIPIYFEWFNYASWFKLANEILLVNQWQNIKNISCDIPAFPPMPSNMTHPFHDPCLYRDGIDVLNYVSFSDENVIQDVVLLIAIQVVFRMLSLFALIIQARRSKE